LHGSPQVASFPQVSPPKPCTRLYSHHTPYMPRPSHSWFYQPSNIGWRVQILLILIIIMINKNINVFSCHRPFLPGTSLEPAVIPTAQASSFTLQYFPYYVW
jgi:hypothetical protein